MPPSSTLAAWIVCWPSVPTDVRMQSTSARSPNAVGAGVVLIAVGLIKKVAIADFLAREVADPVFAVPQAYAAPDVALAAYAYAVQIYCDFSGYTDIAIGLALLMGFVFPQNFDHPYRSRSIREFWRRWHMTLSRFLREEAEELYWNELAWEKLTGDDPRARDGMAEFAFPGFLAFIDGLLLRDTSADSPVPASPRPEVVEDVLVFLAERCVAASGADEDEDSAVAGGLDGGGRSHWVAWGW